MRARPTPEWLEAQRRAKERWHREAAALPFEEKIRQVIALQHRVYPIMKLKGRLAWWQRPWDDRFGST